ncbi:MAG: Gfo/Idh/MocA family oxidoreductase [Chitinophagaceae bacterium]|jgi:predicted dehydrogenase
MSRTRRNFIKKSSAASAAIVLGGVLPGFSASQYRRIIGSNEKITAAVMGVNSRGFSVGSNFASQKECEMMYVCDVDVRAMDKCVAAIEKVQGKKPKAEGDFRKALEDPQLDLLIVTAPDHWHAPAALLAVSAGKHVYLEKPCSHNPNEGEMLVKAAAKHNKLLQMGNQRRSWPNVIAAIGELRAGAIGRPYYAKTWYTNNRESIGVGKTAEVPSWLNYDLWQGPAPRRAYKDNVIHYNWHWFWHWGTGEALNNGTHMVDLARWGLGVEYPTRVTSAGGRYRYQDDWETPDTQVIDLEFANNTLISWEGRSCNGKNTEGSSVGVIFYGETGSLLIESGNAYKIFDLRSKLVKEVKNDIVANALDRTGPGMELDALHIRNFFDAIKRGTKLNSDILSGHQSTLLVQLGNISQRTGRALKVDPNNGRILNDKEAMKLWSREYEKGWEPKI